MKVLFLSRKTLFSVQGGDTVQILKTAEALRRKDVFVDVSTELEPDLRGYDLVHVFIAEGDTFFFKTGFSVF